MSCLFVFFSFRFTEWIASGVLSCLKSIANRVAASVFSGIRGMLLSNDKLGGTFSLVVMML